MWDGMCGDVAKFGIHNNVSQKPRATAILSQMLRPSTKRGQHRRMQSKEKESPWIQLYLKLDSPADGLFQVVSQ